MKIPLYQGLLPFSLALGLALASIVTALSPAAGATELIIFTWEDYISTQVIKNFQAKTGIQVRQVYFDSDQTRDEIVASARGKEFDLVVFDGVAVQIFGKNDRLLAINSSQVPNFANIDQRWQESCGNFGVPYSYGTVGILYDQNKFAAPPDSWQDLLQPAPAHHGHLAMIEDMTDILTPALLYLGYNINSEKEDQLKAAYSLLQQQVPAVLNYKYGLTNLKADDRQSELHLALGYSGDQHAMNETSPGGNWAYVIPREGTAVWVDCLAVTAWSSRKESALAFLDYLSDPEVAAKNAEEIHSIPTVTKARQHMSPEAAADPALFPNLDTLNNVQMYRILSDSNLRLRRRILDTLIKRHEAQ
ncbi:ABC transporter substrate-binding protein [Desulfogranum mediterraneum]|uniref:ABC transporter substrate-binding protein n=1 Tax=Desulfogranum mediterraneum TaxID=160661 RepID=UPI0004044324|nr:spermidine/putrescine ABC transporter substrate-binding protein [Desulfogranum mediterraneum]